MSVCSFVSAGLDGQKISADAMERNDARKARLSFMVGRRVHEVEVSWVSSTERLRVLDLYIALLEKHIVPACVYPYGNICTISFPHFPMCLPSPETICTDDRYMEQK